MFSFKNEQLLCGFFEGCMLSFAQKTPMSVSACHSVAWEGMGRSDRYRIALLSDWARDPVSAKVLEPFLVEPAGIEWRRQWHPAPVLLPEKSHGWRSLVGCSPWGRKESDRTERLHFHVSLSCTGEGNGNPLQCSCLESPRDGGAWWAAVYGVAQRWTQLKQLSSVS